MYTNIICYMFASKYFSIIFGRTTIRYFEHLPPKTYSNLHALGCPTDRTLPLCSRTAGDKFAKLTPDSALICRAIVWHMGPANDVSIADSNARQLCGVGILFHPRHFGIIRFRQMYR